MICTKKRMCLCIALLALNIAFIWGNSLMPAEISKAISGFARTVISTVLGLEGAGGEATFGEGILRKIAHFVEFACLGALLCWLFSMLKQCRLYAFGCGFLAACVDETIQVFVPGRGPGIKDVLLDSVGVVCGIALLLAGYTIYQKRKIKMEE